MNFRSLLTGKRESNFTRRVVAEVSKSMSRIALPDVIREEFREDYNVVKLTSLVAAKIASEFEASPLLLEEIESKEEILQTMKGKVGEARLRREVEETRKKYERHSDPSRLSSFRKASSDYVTSYKAYPLTEVREEGVRYVPKKDDLIRIAIIEQYAVFLKEYIDISLVSYGKTAESCPNCCSACGESLAEVVPDTDGSVTCPECLSFNLLKVAPVTVSEVSSKSGCEDAENFVKALNRYQGKLVPNLCIRGVKMTMETVIGMLDEYFQREGKLSCAESSRKRLNTRGIREGTSVNIMLAAMSEIKLKCYSDVYYICKAAWKWELADLSDLEEVLVTDYEVTQKAWYGIPADMKSRSSSLPMGYRLCQHLRVRGFECSEGDFKIPKNLSVYNEIWKYMCEHCGDDTIKYSPLS